jgi:hypothetical protein
MPKKTEKDRRRGLSEKELKRIHAGKPAIEKPAVREAAEQQRLRDEDSEQLVLMVLATPGQHRLFEGFKVDDIENLLDNLVDLASGGTIGFAQELDLETRERAAMAVCRILTDRPLHLPEICERCGLPIRGPLESPTARTSCTCRKR